MTGTTTMTDPIPLVEGIPLLPVVYVVHEELDPSEPARPDLPPSVPSSRFQLPQAGISSLSDDTIQGLMDQGYTRGLAEALECNNLELPLAIWIVDNSGSMSKLDGHRVVQESNTGTMKLSSCTRWAEMQQTVEYHARLAATLQSPTVFRLLNHPGRTAGKQTFSVAERPSEIEEDLKEALHTMWNTYPVGQTPLTSHLKKVEENISGLAEELRETGTKVVVVLATDGIPTNEHGVTDDNVKREFVDALRSLQKLPVWVVVRLCSDEDVVVNYWNSLDGELELGLEVLDDFYSEAKEVHGHNKWLNYGLPLHRMREKGFHHNLLDLLDERKVDKCELRDFFRILFGDANMDGTPDPEEDWEGFYNHMSTLTGNEGKTWNPVSAQLEPWIDLKKLESEYR